MWLNWLLLGNLFLCRAMLKQILHRQVSVIDMICYIIILLSVVQVVFFMLVRWVRAATGQLCQEGSNRSHKTGIWKVAWERLRESGGMRALAWEWRRESGDVRAAVWERRPERDGLRAVAWEQRHESRAAAWERRHESGGVRAVAWKRWRQDGGAASGH